MRILLIFGAVLVGQLALGAGHAAAATNCSFTTVGTTMKLNANCTTDAPILIPNGFTLDGRGRTITAVDPSGDHFKGAVLTTSGAVAHVKRVMITAFELADVCDTDNDQLRGIFFNGASGSIRDVRITELHQALPTSCPEGSGIIVNKPPFDGTHPATAFVEIERVRVTNMSDVGMQGFGDVSLKIRNSQIRGVPMAQLASEFGLDQFGVVMAFGALGSIEETRIQQAWDADLTRFAFGVDIREASGVRVEENSIIGSTEGVFVTSCSFTGVANGNRIEENRIRAAREGIVLVASGATCAAQVNTNKVIENNIGSAPGFIAFDGIFVGAFPGAFSAQADSNVIKKNRIVGTMFGIVQNGDTNTVLEDNVFIP